MADDSAQAGTVTYDVPEGVRHRAGHDGYDFVSATKQDNGSWLLKYDNGDTVYSGGPAVDKPDPNWTPDTSMATDRDPWDIYKGSQPPFQTPPNVPGGVDSPGKGVNVISVDAIRYYATSIRALLPVIRDTIKDLDGLAADGFGPGNFGAANNFKAKVFGTGDGKSGASLITSTRQVFVAAETIINEVSSRCDEIVQKYKTADELTELDADEFTRMVANVSAKVNDLPLGTAS